MVNRAQRLFLLTMLALLLVLPAAHAREMTLALDGLTGGTSGKLDAIPVSTTSGVSTTGSLAISRDSSGATVYIHQLVTTGAAENSPHVIKPDDAGAGATRWGCTWGCGL